MTRGRDELCDDHERPDYEGAILSKAIEEDLGHRLANRAIEEVLEVIAHAERESNIDS